MNWRHEHNNELLRLRRQVPQQYSRFDIRSGELTLRHLPTGKLLAEQGRRHRER